MAINVTAPVNTLGYGVVSNNLVAALDEAGGEPALWPIGPVETLPNCHDAVRASLGRARFFDPYAASLRVWHQFELAQHVGRGPRLAYPFFELNQFTRQEVHHLQAQDVVVAPSTWARDLLEGVLPQGRVVVANPGVDREVFHPGVKPSRLPGAEGRTVFFSAGKWEVRKGHDVLCKAFNLAFTPGDEVHLLMACHNPCLGADGERVNREWREYYENSALGRCGKIAVLGHRLEGQAELASLMAAADCGVFPSRGEGWGMESAEMLCMGKHVIATAYSAHADYLTNSNARLVDVSKTEPAHDGIWFHGQGEWAELGPPQLEQLVEHLRAVHRRKQDGTLGENRAGVASMAGFTWANTAKAVLAAG